MTTVVFETHSTSEHNEAGIATGWLGGALSATGRAQAIELGRRRRGDGIELVVASDLWRAMETASIAFEGFNIFNSTNFGCYDGFIPAPPATNPKFGTPSCTVDNSSRRLQFGLRYAF